MTIVDWAIIVVLIVFVWWRGSSNKHFLFGEIDRLGACIDELAQRIEDLSQRIETLETDVQDLDTRN